MNTALHEYTGELAYDEIDRVGCDGATSDTARTLVRIWTAVLEADHIGPDDNFFLLGGDSLRATALYAEVEAHFGVALPLETVFDEGETVTGMASLIDRMMAEARPVAPDSPKSHDGTAVKPDVPAMPLLAKGDTTAAITLMLLAAVAWLPRRSLLPVFCRLMARAHIAWRGARARDLSPAVGLLDSSVSPEDIELGVVAGGYEEIANTLRQYGPLPPRPAVRLHGGEHIDAALAVGRGAVLWNFAGVPGSRIAAQCLKEAGIPLVQLRSATHPLSGSRFGTGFLNPVLNRIDDRNLSATVTVHETTAVDALQMLGNHLRNNAVVRISAHGSGDMPYEMPFLGGTLRLALGAPSLAVMHDAPLLPVFSLPDGSGGFDVIVEAPLAGGNGTSGQRARAMAERYADLLEGYIRQHPRIWRGWFMRNTWRPESGRSTHNA